MMSWNDDDDYWWCSAGRNRVKEVTLSTAHAVGTVKFVNDKVMMAETEGALQYIMDHHAWGTDQMEPQSKLEEDKSNDSCK